MNHLSVFPVIPERQQLTVHQLKLVFISTETRDYIARKISEDGDIRSVEIDLVRADGSKIICLYCGVVIKIEGKQCLLSIGFDITKRKMIEQALESQSINGVIFW